MVRLSDYLSGTSVGVNRIAHLLARFEAGGCEVCFWDGSDFRGVERQSYVCDVDSVLAGG